MSVVLAAHQRAIEKEKARLELRKLALQTAQLKQAEKRQADKERQETHKLIKHIKRTSISSNKKPSNLNNEPIATNNQTSSSVTISTNESHHDMLLCDQNISYISTTSNVTSTHIDLESNDRIEQSSQQSTPSASVFVARSIQSVIPRQHVNQTINPIDSVSENVLSETSSSALSRSNVPLITSHIQSSPSVNTTCNHLDKLSDRIDLIPNSRSSLPISSKSIALSTRRSTNPIPPPTRKLTTQLSAPLGSVPVNQSTTQLNQQLSSVESVSLSLVPRSRLPTRVTRIEQPIRFEQNDVTTITPSDNITPVHMTHTSSAEIISSPTALSPKPITNSISTSQISITPHQPTEQLTPPPLPARPRSVNKWLLKAAQSPVGLKLGRPDTECASPQSDISSSTLVTLSDMVQPVVSRPAPVAPTSLAWTDSIGMNNGMNLDQDNSVAAVYRKKVAELTERANRRRHTQVTADIDDTQSVASHSSIIQSAAPSTRSMLSTTSSTISTRNRRHTSPSSSASSSSTCSFSSNSRSNRQHVLNALNFSLLSSRSFLATRLAVVHCIQQHPAQRFLLLLTRAHTAAFTFKSLFAMDMECQRAIQIWPVVEGGMQPTLTPADCSEMLKFDSATKSFTSIEASQMFTPSTDAVVRKKRQRK